MKNKTRKRKILGGSNKIVFYTCFFGKSANKGDTISLPPSKKYPCYFFSNNHFTLKKAESVGYKIVYINTPIKYTNRNNAVDSKELKACPHHFAELKGYEYTCYYDSKRTYNEDYVLQLLSKLDGDKCMLLNYHESIKDSVRKEFNVAMHQPRYAQNKNKYTKHINDHVKKGYKDVFKHHYNTGFIIRKSGDVVDKIGDEWFKAIQETGAECQITFFFIQQKYDNYIIGIDWKDMISMWILCWKSPLTLKNTLDSYKNNNLFNIVTPYIYFQERDTKSEDIAEQYEIKNVYGSHTNVGIIKAFQEMIKNTYTPYLIFAECDFELIHGEDKIIKIIEDSVKMIREEGVKIVKLRDRKNPGEPLFSRNSISNLKTHTFNNFKWSLEALHFLEKPEEKMPNKFTIKDDPSYNYKWYISTFLDNQWSNNIFIGDTQFLKSVILPILDKIEDKANPSNLEKGLSDPYFKQTISNYKIAAGDGLFTHKRLDR